MYMREQKVFGYKRFKLESCMTQSVEQFKLRFYDARKMRNIREVFIHYALFIK